ncbi:MAG: TolC family protein [Burkholderiaceae bacterium]
MNDIRAAVRPRARQAMICMVVLTVLGGCAVTPEPMTVDAIKARVAEDQRRMYADQTPINGPMSFSDVVARVMQNNLDFRLRMMEATLAQRQLDVGKWDMFPRLMANAGWVTRNNDSGGRSVSIETGLETLSNSSSQERTRTLGGLEFSWNLLDFGVSLLSRQVARRSGADCRGTQAQGAAEPDAGYPRRLLARARRAAALGQDA